MVKTKKIMYYLLPLISAFFIFSFFTGPVAAEDNLMDNNPSNWNVYSNQTIQNAINNASPGDTIIINEGTYNENIIVNKTNLTLKSNGIVTISAFDPNQPGIYIDSSGNNAKINGFTITDALYNAGIYLSGTVNCVISGNTITNNGQGIYLDLSTNNIISENNLNSNYNYGVNLVNSPGNKLKNNLFANNWNNLEVTGNSISDYKQDIDTSNIINGNSIYFLVEQNGLTYDGISMGYLALISCSHIQINNVSITDSSQISLINTTNSVLENCNFRDNYENKIFLLNSSYNTISKVSTTKISLESSNNNIISENDIKSNNSNGISLLNSSNNSIISNAISIGSGPVSCTVSLSTKTLDDSPKNFSDNDNGIYLESSSNNIISQNSLNDNNYNHASGICINSSPNNTISNNILSNNSYGINVYNSPNNNIIENNVTDNNYGVYIENSSGSILKNNTLANNDYNFDVSGDDASDYTQDINTTNTINGDPIYYLIEQDGLILDGTSIGYLALISCASIQVKNINITKNGKGILLLNTTNSKIENNTITDNSGYGIELWNSSNNTISNNNLINNGAGIYLESSLNDYISKNNIKNVDYSQYGNSGIFLKNSSKNEITENSMTDEEIYVECSTENNLNKNNTSKIILKLSPNNNISENNTSNISIVSSSNNNLSNNIILNNDYTGIYLESSSKCTISNNIITGNAKDNNHYYGDTIGISLENSSENIISDNNISSYSRGVYINNSNNNIIMNNSFISDVKFFGIAYKISFFNPESYGLSFDGSSSNNTISGNTVTNNAYGIYFHLNSNNTVNNNILNENNIGILVEESSKNNISKNNISNGTYGILTWPLDSSSGSNNNSISENIITNQSFAGIHITSSSKFNTIFNNTITNSDRGIYSDLSLNNSISDNKINNNSFYGIYLTNSIGNTVENNQIQNNNNGIYLNNSIENNIKNNQIQNNNNGIYLDLSSNNTISEDNITNNVNGLQTFSSNISITKCIILNSNKDIYLYNSSINAIKSTFDESKIDFGDSNSSLTTNWDFYVKVVDKNGTPVKNACVIIRQNDGTSLLLQNGRNDINNTFCWAITDENGLIKVDDTNWNNHVLNSQNINNYVPYSVTVIYESQDYVMQNSLTQRCYGFTAGPLLFEIPLNISATNQTNKPSLLWISGRGPKIVSPNNYTPCYIDLYNLGPMNSDFAIINLNVDSVFQIIRVESTDNTILWDANNIENQINEIKIAFQEKYPEEYANMDPETLNKNIRDYLLRNVVILIKDVKVGEMKELKVIINSEFILHSNGNLRFTAVNIPLITMPNTDIEISENSVSGDKLLNSIGC